MQYRSIAGQQIAYHKSGAGDPLVLVHGITTYSFVWDLLIPHLQPHFSVYRFDLLGCGDSAMPLDQSYALVDHAERLAELLAQLQIERPHLVGHDLGGGIAQIFAVRYPAKLRSLCLLNPVGYDHWPVQPISIMRTPVIRQLLMAIVDRRLFRIAIERGLYDKQKLTPELLERYWKPLATAQGRKAFLHFAKCLDNRDLTAISGQLQSIDLPTLILWGSADPYLSEEIVERLHREIPGSRLQRCATAAHYLMIDEPEWVAEQIRQFLQELDAID